MCNYQKYLTKEYFSYMLSSIYISDITYSSDMITNSNSDPCTTMDLLCDIHVHVLDAHLFLKFDPLVHLPGVAVYQEALAGAGLGRDVLSQQFQHYVLHRKDASVFDFD